MSIHGPQNWLPHHMTTLQIDDMSIVIDSMGTHIPIVENISMVIYPGDIVGVIGESGSGKSVTFLGAFNIPNFDSRISLNGSVRLLGREIYDIPPKDRHTFVAHNVSFVFQNQQTVLNPLWPIGEQFTFYIMKLTGKKRYEVQNTLKHAMELMGIDNVDTYFNLLPSELSGGLLQRVFCAFAIARPFKLLIADEVTSFLDPILTNKIVNEIFRVASSRKASLVFITHDLHSIYKYINKLIIMYSGEIIESGNKSDIVNDPSHPYTKLLVDSACQITRDEEGPLDDIAFNVMPDVFNRPQGCRFQNRCPFPLDVCLYKRPPLISRRKGHIVRCFRAEKFK